MKINDTIKKTIGLDTERVNTNGSSKKAEKSQVISQGTEKVTLSPLSEQLKSLEASTAADEVFDAEKVEAIKSAIASGQFKVDAEKVADGLIATVKDLLSTKNA